MSNGATRSRFQWWRDLPADRRVELLFALCLVVFTLGQIYYGKLQWEATRDQYEVMIQQNKVAKQAIDAEKQNAMLDVRAFVFATLDESVPLLSDDAKDRLTVGIRLENAGPTPATEVTLRASSIIVEDRSKVSRPRGIVDDDDMEFDTLFIAAHGNKPLVIKKTINESERERLKDGSGVATIRGTIIYKDVFGHVQRHPLEMYRSLKGGRETLRYGTLKDFGFHSLFN